jgi:threonine 3-dehydrogenase
VDIVLDFTGSSSALEDSFWFVRDGGQIVVTGLSPSILELNLVSLVRKEVQIKGSYGYTCEEVKQVMKMVDRGQVELDPIITHRLPLEDVNKGFDLLREGNTLRTLIIP